MLSSSQAKSSQLFEGQLSLRISKCSEIHFRQTKRTKTCLLLIISTFITIWFLQIFLNQQMKICSHNIWMHDTGSLTTGPKHKVTQRLSHRNNSYAVVGKPD